MTNRFDLPVLGGTACLTEGDLELVAAPACGARIVSFRKAGRDVLRPASAHALASGDVYGFAGFPLLPYSGPIFGGGFIFDGHFHALARTVPQEPTATHGEGWIRPWRTVEQAASRLVVEMDHLPSEGTFPFAWRGRIAYALGPAGLAITLTLTNRDHRRMPAGLGFHPYFPKAPGTILTFDATGVWPPDAPEHVGLPAGPIEAGLDFRQGMDAASLVIDRCFEGWAGQAIVTAADGSTTKLVAEPVFGKLQVYDAWDYAYLCVEPVSNANDGFNRLDEDVPGHGVAVLEPGRSLSGSIQIRAT